MSDLIYVLKQRRSIRKYQKTPVPKDTILQILETAAYAPSAHNAQPWRFISLTKEKTKNDLAEAMAQVWLKELHKDGTPESTRKKLISRSIERFTSAPCLIVACMALRDMDSYPDSERQMNERDLGVQSLGAAIQNLLLAAHANGLGACWCCAPIFCKTAVRKVLEIPDEVEPHALIAVGFPDENPKIPKRFELKDYVSFEKWGNVS